MTHILGVDIGTTGMKMGVFRKADGALTLRGHFPGPMKSILTKTDCSAT